MTGLSRGRYPSVYRRVVHWWGSTDQYGHFALQPRPQSILLDLQVVSRLKIQPESVGSTEVASEPQRRVCRNRAIAVYDLVHTPRGHADLFRQPVLGDPQRLQEFLQEHFTRMNGR